MTSFRFYYPFIGLMIFFVGCSVNQQAAELVNSVAHNMPLDNSAATIPMPLVSGECTNQISGSTTSLTGTAYGTFALITLNISLELGDGSNATSTSTSSPTTTTASTAPTDGVFNCNLQLLYQLNSTGNQLVGPGAITVCDSTFNCNLNGTTIACQDLQEALQKYTCSAVVKF